MTVTRRSMLLACAGFAAGSAFAEEAGFAAAARYSAERRGVSMVALRGGRVVFEDYPGEGGPDRAWELASGTKSFCGVLAARLAREGLLALNEPCAATLREWRDESAKARITIEQLLTLTGGVGGGRIARPPAYAEAVAAPLSSAPGERFAYGPAPFQVFGEIVRRKLEAAGRPSDPVAYLQTQIFDPLGVRPQRWRRGVDGHPHMPSGAALTARDWAMFGDWVMSGGGGRLDPATLEAFWRGTPANPGYGLTWWLLRPGLRAPGPRSGIVAEDAIFLEEDVRMAAGAGDQRLYLVPKRGLVIVRQTNAVLAALTGERLGFSDAEFLRLIARG